MARPEKITDDIVRKLENAFARGFNVSEACDDAEISRDTYYKKIKKSKSFSDKMERAQTNLVRQAKINLAEAIKGGDLAESKYYLERKCKDEFSTRRELQVGGEMNVNNPFAGLTSDELRKLVNIDDDPKK
ncbi:MAG: hypothetical protein Q8876_07435 [Bacillota bacterium]|nr:hypothetical protein [Bacillota bacterium]